MEAQISRSLLRHRIKVISHLSHPYHKPWGDVDGGAIFTILQRGRTQWELVKTGVMWRRLRKTLSITAQLFVNRVCLANAQLDVGLNRSPSGLEDPFTSQVSESDHHIICDGELEVKSASLGRSEMLRQAPSAFWRWVLELWFVFTRADEFNEQSKSHFALSFPSTSEWFF